MTDSFISVKLTRAELWKIDLALDLLSENGHDVNDLADKILDSITSIQALDKRAGTD